MLFLMDLNNIYHNALKLIDEEGRYTYKENGWLNVPNIKLNIKLPLYN